MAGTTIEALKAKHNHGTNVRKGLNVIIFMAPASAKLPATSSRTPAGGPASCRPSTCRWA